MVFLPNARFQLFEFRCVGGLAGPSSVFLLSELILVRLQGCSDSLVFVLHRLNDGHTDLLLEAAGKSFRVLFVQGLQLETRIDPLLNRLPKPRTFGNC